MLFCRTYTPQVRSKDQIENQPGIYERDQFAPKPQTKYRGFYEKDKSRLANIMAYGEDIPPPDWKKVIQRIAPQELSPTDRYSWCLFHKGKAGSRYFHCLLIRL